MDYVGNKVMWMILLENVSVIRNKKHILKNVFWKVEKGEHWCILGLNGSGKTTILNVVNGFFYPSEGKATVLGEQFGKTKMGELKKRIGYISFSLQDQIFGIDSVLSIVLCGKFASFRLHETVSQEDVDKAYALLKMLNIEHFAEQSFQTLSQGELQKVLIARALFAEPEILILDEPCNGLDLIAREELLQFIAKVAQSENAPTLIYVTHHVEEILPCFTHTLLMKEGEVFSSGLTKDLLTEENLSSFYGRPVSVQYEQNRAWLALK